MKQHFIKPAPQIDSLSLEEEAVLMDEMMQHSDEIDNCANQAERIEAIQQGVDDVAVIVSTQPIVGEIDQALAQVVADMAVVGSDADPADLLPPANEQGQLVTEGFVETVKNLW